ncbi:MAG TPA: sigma-70 family RNA polymerase sigma factor [Thermoanaerobaculia bacterium]|nr:sigma-70 family RNA polymerase sigma factor [Thermoanaerobaculia bacterium]
MRFATTQWSLVVAAGQRGSAEAEAALERLCSQYWYPVFVFVRRQGHSLDQAEDLTQSFFTRLIEKEVLHEADQSRGRFRSFLLVSCQRFLSNERDRTLAAKRGGGKTPLSIDASAAEARYQHALAHEETPERLYERQWCVTLLERVLDDLREEYVTEGRQQLFERLRGFLTIDGDSGSQAEAARDLGMTIAAVKVAVHRLRRRYREALREHVAATVASPDEVEDERRYLLNTLRNL